MVYRRSNARDDVKPPATGTWRLERTVPGRIRLVANGPKRRRAVITRRRDDHAGTARVRLGAGLLTIAQAAGLLTWTRATAVN